MATRAPRGAAMFAQQRKYLFDCVQPLYEEPLALDEGSGSWVKDVDGEEYLDLFAGILTTSLGHCHPAVVSAVQEQVSRLGHVSTLYVTAKQVEAARRLGAITPGNLNRTFFTNSGSEAIETALMTARLHTGRSEIVALRHGYHGRTPTSLTAQAPWRPLPGNVAGISHALAPYPYRAAFGDVTDEALVEIYANDLIEVIETTTNGQPAAFIAETLLGVGGYIVPPPGYFKRMAEVIRSYGGLFISDEVQTGFGRTGDHWFGVEHWDVIPDILVVAKGVAGGLPVGATITTDAVAGSWRGKSISTFGGNPVCMAAMAAVLDVMRAENVPIRARERGDQLRRGLETIAAEYPWIGEVRGMGLMQALELVRDPSTKEPAPDLAKALLHRSKDERLLVGIGGLYGQVIRLGPSLLISEDEIDAALLRFSRACTAVDNAER